MCQTPRSEQLEVDFEDDEDIEERKMIESDMKNEEKLLLIVPADRFIRRMETSERRICTDQSLQVKYNGWKEMIGAVLANQQAKHNKMKPGIEYSEIALFRLSCMIDLLIGLVDEAQEGFQLICEFSHPFYLSLLIQISLDSSP